MWQDGRCITMQTATHAETSSRGFESHHEHFFIQKKIFTASLGNTLGFATYVPTARRRMMDNLPEESTLRRMLTGDIGPDDWNSPNQELAAWEAPKKQLEVFDDQVRLLSGLLI